MPTSLLAIRGGRPHIDDCVNGSRSSPVRGGARAHYDRFPYDVGVEPGRYLERPGLLGDFLRDIDGGVAVDVGCGPGNVLFALAERASCSVGVDLSEASLRLARRRNGGSGDVSFLHGDALRLPLADQSADYVCATGSLHHTGDPEGAFQELCRVLRPGGGGFVAVYRAGSYYELAYRSVGRVCRACQRYRPTDALVNRGVIRPLFAVYLVVGRVIEHRSVKLPTRTQLDNYFADQLLNPVVSFHTAAELATWAEAGGLSVLGSATGHAGALEAITFRKMGGPENRAGEQPARRRRTRQRGIRLRVKRSFDLAAAVALLLLSLPVMAVVAAAIRIVMGPPVLFRQVRPGRHGTPFTLLKFRTMSEDSDTSGTPLPDDKRLTWLGRLIRTCTLDELPQLFNVLRGEMSLVGARPLLLEYLPLYSAEESRRHDVLPGITGWAQVNGRNATTWPDRFRDDVWYVDNWSLWLDVRILAMTVSRVVKRTGTRHPGHATMPNFVGTDTHDRAGSEQ